jgi:hypothetical protein
VVTVLNGMIMPVLLRYRTIFEKLLGFFLAFIRPPFDNILLHSSGDHASAVCAYTSAEVIVTE